MGRQPSYGFVGKKVRQIWERKGTIDIFDLENDFYLINFQHVDDYMEALIRGPCVITNAYLSVTHWRPDFDPKNERIEFVVAWVRFPDLLAPLFDKNFLLNLSNSIGKAIRLDIHAAQRARGKFARICIELDLMKPLVPEFNVDGQILTVVYESLSLLCNKCSQFSLLHVELGNDEEGMNAANETRKVIMGKGDKVLMVNNKGNVRRNVAKVKNSFGSCEVVPESNLDLYRWKEVDMDGKENLHPGEFMERIDMDTCEVKIVDDNADTIDNLGTYMVEVYRAPALAD
ncbi:hypothetical protein K1719_002863 [Acacia pycnantha]|nr:hypothetical protein K1719_002863 [Acacia pycnantha]